MKITLIDAGKRFNRDWIFRHLSYEFLPRQHYAITGPNGSGKSTLLQAIAGAIGISEGRVRYEQASTATPASPPAAEIPPDQAYRYFSLSAPYLDLIEEMTAIEFLRFHHSFKPFLPALPIPAILAAVGLDAAANKQIRFFSSGMKQRIKLAQALFSDTPVVLLDEPTTNLDAEGIALYQRLIREYTGDRLVIVSSNDVQEYEFCEKVINITEHK
ncbi:MAG TPA: ATP-binding cassette domain-containing protein [Puia sp.]|jgi:ABC-2 type transport system ATP-binding protein|nr:ATP-binding cassette domain-containing protein [Puia sp.]